LCSSFPSIARSAVELVRRWRERSRARRLLAAMNERELEDIGVCRTDIAEDVGRPFWRDMKGRLP
jgi:uncharacterized protein YjiS (DUF1127 family)